MKTDILHTPEQKREKLRGLIQSVHFLKDKFDDGELRSDIVLKHELDSIVQLANEAKYCIDSFDENE